MSSNALFVLREEQELVSQEDMIDYTINHPYCHYINNQANEKNQKPKEDLDGNKDGIIPPVRKEENPNVDTTMKQETDNKN